jgi:hypothetical protein
MPRNGVPDSVHVLCTWILHACNHVELTAYPARLAPRSSPRSGPAQLRCLVVLVASVRDDSVRACIVA